MEYVAGTESKLETVRDLIKALEEHEAHYGPDARVLLLGLVRNKIGEVDASKTIVVRLDDGECAILIH